MYSAYTEAKAIVLNHVYSLNISTDKLEKKLICPSRKGHVSLCLSSLPSNVANDVKIACDVLRQRTATDDLAYVEIVGDYANFEIGTPFFLRAVEKYRAELPTRDYIPTCESDYEYAMVRMHMLSRKRADNALMLSERDVVYTLWECFAAAEITGKSQYLPKGLATDITETLDKIKYYDRIGGVADCVFKLLCRGYDLL